MRNRSGSRRAETILCLFLSLAFPVRSFPAACDEADEALNPKEFETLLRESHFEKTVEIQGWRVPIFILYRIIPFPVEISAAVFSDVENHPRYFPDVVYNRIDSEPSPSRLILKFEQKLILGFRDRATLENRFYRGDSSYFVRWKIIESEKAEKGEGLVAFRPLRGQTLMRYCALVEPKSWLGRTLVARPIVMGELKTLLEKTGSAIARERANDTALLDRQKLLLSRRFAIGEDE